MPQPTPRRSRAAAEALPPALGALGEIARALASGASLDVVVPEVLGSICALLGADSGGVWVTAAEETAGMEPAPLRRAWGCGDPPPDEDAVRRAIAEGDGAGGVHAAPLEAGGRRLGALAVRLPRALAADERLALATVATMLAPVLSQAEYAHRLEAEVAERTTEIERQRRFITKVVDSLPFGLYVIDADFRIQAWNRKRETGMQGVSREEAIGRPIFEILHRQPEPLLRREFRDVFESGQVQEFQTESDASGEVRTFRITKIPMRLDDVNVTHVITVGEDVSEWREAQDRIAQAEKLAAIGTLAAGIMHEINNPLATIAACAEAAALRMGDEPAGAPLAVESRAALDETFRLIESEVHRCKGIVDSLLDFSRPKAATKAVVDVNAAIERTLFLLKHHSRFKRLGVRFEGGHDPAPMVVASEEQLVQVFMSLLINAMDAMRERGTVVLRTRVDDGIVYAEVEDHGEGIRRTDLKKIFEPFFTTKPPGRGTGLGLSICYAIVSEHGGRIEVDSQVGEGSVFRIILPRAQGAIAGAPEGGA